MNNLEIKHIRPEETNGFSQHGFKRTIRTTFNELVKIFNVPQFIKDENCVEDKINYEWFLEINGIKCTIFDWKYYDGFSKSEEIKWNINTKDKFDTATVQKLIENLIEVV